MAPMRSLRVGRGRRPAAARRRCSRAPLADLRAKSTDEISQGPSRRRHDCRRLGDSRRPVRRPSRAGRQNAVDVLVGSNKDEGSFILRGPTAEQWTSRVRERWGDLADAYLKLYPAGSDDEAAKSSEAAFRRRDGVAHAPVRPGAGEAREAGVPLLLHARAAGRRRVSRTCARRTRRKFRTCSTT